MTEKEDEEVSELEELSGLLQSDNKNIKSSLDKYLKEIKSNEVTTANLTTKQAKAIIPLKWLSKVYFEPLVKRYDQYQNLPEKMIESIVESGKGKKGFALEKMGDILNVRKTVERKSNDGDKDNG